MNNYTLNLSSYNTQGNYHLSKLYLEDHTRLTLNLEHIPETYIPLYMKIDWGFGDVELHDNDLLLSKLNKLNFLQYSSLLNTEYNFEYYPSETSLYKELSAQVFIKYSNGDELKFLIPIQIRTYGFLESLGNISLINSNLLPNEYNTPEYQLKTNIEEYLFELKDTRNKKIINTGDVAGLLESYAESGEKVPAGIYCVDRTITLDNNNKLMLVEGVEIRVDHDSAGVSVTGSNVSICGGSITGTKPLTNWTTQDNKIIEHNFVSTEKIRTLRINGNTVSRCRYPETGYITGVIDADDDPADPTDDYDHVLMNVLFDDAILATNLPKNPQDIEWFAQYSFLLWGTTLQSLIIDSGITLKAHYGAYMNYGTRKIPVDGVNWLENAPEFLTPGTWCHDRANNKILYMLKPGESVENISAETDTTDVLVSVEGTEESPVDNFSINGTYLSHSSYKFRDNERIRFSEIPYNKAALAILGYCGNVSLRNMYIHDNSHVGSVLFTEKSFGTNIFENSIISNSGSCGIHIGNWARGDENQHTTPDRPILTLNTVLVENSAYMSGGEGSGIRIDSLENSTWNNVKVLKSGYGGIICGGAASAVNSCKNNTFNGIEISEWLLRLDDVGGFYLVGIQDGTELNDCVCHGLSGLHNTGGVYLENNSKGITVNRTRIYDIDSDLSYHMKVNVRSNECKFLDTRYEKPLHNGWTTYNYRYSYGPDKNATDYWTYHRPFMKFTVDSTSTSGSEMTISYSDKDDYLPGQAWPTAWPLPPHIEPSDNPIGCWIMPIEGTSAWKWFRITAKTDTSLTILTTDEEGTSTNQITSGDRVLVMWVYEHGSVLLDKSEMAAEIENWRASHPEPIIT